METKFEGNIRYTHFLFALSTNAPTLISIFIGLSFTWAWDAPKFNLVEQGSQFADHFIFTNDTKNKFCTPHATIVVNRVSAFAWFHCWKKKFHRISDRSEFSAI